MLSRSRFAQGLVHALAWVATPWVFAAAPTIQVLKIDSVLWGETAPMYVEATDADGNLTAVKLFAQGPGISGESEIANVPVSGSSAVVNFTWNPPGSGYFTIRAVAQDGTTGPSVSKVFEVFLERRTYGAVTLNSGQGVLFEANGEIVTSQNNSAPSVVAQPGSTMILWAKSRIKLKPGFRANAGSFFWAAVDADMNGYSDQEETADTDNDNMPDVWELSVGLNPAVNDAAGDLDQDGVSNYTEFLTGKKPNDPNDSPGLPAGYQLVLRTPTNTYLGLKTANWQLDGIPSP